jgi:hypothetical protein
MFGRKVEDMWMTWIAQEGSALHTMAQVLGYQGHLAPLRHHTADVKAPVGIEIQLVASFRYRKTLAG